MQITPDEWSAGALTPDSLHRALRTFREAGYVALEDAFDLGFLREVRAEYETMLHAHLEGRGGLDALEGKTFGKNHVGFHPPLVAPLADSRIVAHPIAVQLMRELLGPDLQCGFYNTNTAMPGSGIQPVHRDTTPLFGVSFPVPHPVSTLVLNVPLCDFDLENGSTEVWPGSHLLVDLRPEDGKDLEARAADLPSARTNLKLGSLVLRDMRMFHRGMPNRSDSPRTMLALVYSRGFIRTDTMAVPHATWETWDETARRIFRHNRVTEEAGATNIFTT